LPYPFSLTTRTVLVLILPVDTDHANDLICCIINFNASYPDGAPARRAHLFLFEPDGPAAFMAIRISDLPSVSRASSSSVAFDDGDGVDAGLAGTAEIFQGGLFDNALFGTQHDSMLLRNPRS
jgi:hypothetical protein